jgi:phage FluMu protein Com
MKKANYGIELHCDECDKFMGWVSGEGYIDGTVFICCPTCKKEEE